MLSYFQSALIRLPESFFTHSCSSHRQDFCIITLLIFYNNVCFDRHILGMTFCKKLLWQVKRACKEKRLTQKNLVAYWSHKTVLLKKYFTILKSVFSKRRTLLWDSFLKTTLKNPVLMKFLKLRKICVYKWCISWDMYSKYVFIHGELKFGYSNHRTSWTYHQPFNPGYY